MNGYKSAMAEYRELVERKLQDAFPKVYHGQDIVCEAAKYSLMNGGKRIRPILLLEFSRACGGSVFDALPYACAIEMIHTYSLIHDDLPCMDNDAMRRGRPSCHIQYGEEIALLAGDALLTLAFETILKCSESGNQDLPRMLLSMRILAENAGVSGMIGGQVIDLRAEGKESSLEEITAMDQLKTGALIVAAAKMGCVLGRGSEEQLFAAEMYAQKLGLAFQIVDDILDAKGDEATLGKPVGSDAENEKSTYVSLMGIEKCEETARKLTQEAKDFLRPFGENGEYLKCLAEELTARQN